ncbi:hypothetical protein [Nocardia farcinica]|nr:hypothetical protein [Nocardia farcinica]
MTRSNSHRRAVIRSKSVGHLELDLLGHLELDLLSRERVYQIRGRR